MGASVLWVDATHLRTEDESRQAFATPDLVPLRRFGQFEEAVAGGTKAALQFGEPRGMREVAGCEHVHALDVRPGGERLQGERGAGAHGVRRVEVEVGGETHVGWSVARLTRSERVQASRWKAGLC